MVLLFCLLGLLSGTYACAGNSSLGCLRAKLGKAVWRINAIPEIPVTEWISLVRQNRSWDTARQDSGESEGLLDLLADGMDTFLETRSIRFSLPDWMKADNNKVDVDIVKALVTEKSSFVGRGKGGGGKKGYGMMGMMMMGMMGKMAMMSMGLIKLKAMKALMLGALALLIAKFQLFKMLSSKGGDGGESHVIVLGGGSGGHGGGHSGGTGHGGGGGHGGGSGNGGGGGGGTVHVVHETYGPPSGSWGAGGGDSWGGGGGGWSSGGGGGHGNGGWSSGSGGGGGWSSGGGWGKRAYVPDSTHTVSSASSQSVE